MAGDPRSILSRMDENWIPIDMAHARMLKSVTEISEIVQVAWNITSKRVVGEGVHFDLTARTDDSHGMIEDILSGDDTRTPSQRLMSHANKRRFNQPKRAGEGHDSISLDEIFASVRVEWNEFVERLDAEMLRQGFAVVYAKPSRHNPQVLVPYIEDIDHYQIFQRYVPRKGYQYVAVWDNLNETQKREANTDNGYFIEEAIVLVALERHAPSSTGALRSILATAAPLLAELAAMGLNMSYAFYWSSHPPWVPQLGPAGAGTAKGSTNAGMTAAPYANFTDLLQDKSAVQRFERAQKLDDHERMHEDAYRRHQMYQLGRVRAQVERLTNTTPLLAPITRSANQINQRHSLDPPFMTEYPLEAGDTIASGPTPTIPNQILEAGNRLMRMVFLLLGVQPQMVGLEHTNHAANSDVAFAGQNEAIVNRQRDLEPLLAETFRWIYGIDLAGADMLESSPMGTAEPGAAATTETSAKEDDKEKQKKKKAKKEVLVSHAASRPVQPTSVCLADRVRARLCSDPLTTPANLENMLKTHVIEHDTYRDMMLKSACVSTHLAAKHKVDFETVDSWYGHGQDVGTDREINGKGKKRSATDASH